MTRAAAQTTAVFDELDLGPVMVKLHRDLGWEPSAIEKAAMRYRKWLYLVAATGEELVPTYDIDEVWHAHILDTSKYAEDCRRIFGFFLHHFPYLGLRGDADAMVLQARFERTAELWAEEWDEPLVADDERDPHTSEVCSSAPEVCSSSAAEVCSSAPEVCSSSAAEVCSSAPEVCSSAPKGLAEAPRPSWAHLKAALVAGARTESQ